MRFIANIALWAAVAHGTVMPRQVNDSAPAEVADKGESFARLMGPQPIYRYDPNTSVYCQWWYDNHDNSLACRDMPRAMGLTEEEWLRWNPSLKASCAAWVPETSWCIDAFGEPAPPTPPSSSSTARVSSTSSTRSSTSAPATTTRPGNGITTPQPIQTGMVTNCNKFYFVPSGASCQSVLDANRVSLADFFKWNPAVGSTCSSLWANTHACVGVISGAAPPTTTRPANGISTPMPTQGGMVGNCDTFHLVQAGETCARIGARYGIRASRISEWNASVGPSCAGLWASSYVCVRTIGFSPATPVSCHTASDHKTWGDNKPAALNSVIQWCDGNAVTDGSGGFATAQIKRGCYNTPFGNNKIEFVARNDFGSGSFLAIPKCEELMRASVNRCDRGGTGTHEGWWFTSRVVAGRC